MDDKNQQIPDKKSQTARYESFADSKQVFDQVRFLEAVNGNVVLRGRNGRRDQIYPFHRALKRFFAWFRIYQDWTKSSFNKQTEELELVLENFAGCLQEAVKQRFSLNIPIPKIYTPEVAGKLDQARLILRPLHSSHVKKNWGNLKKT